MAILINAYCTVRHLPPLEFPHRVHGQRDRRDAELAEHLRGFVGYVLRDEDELTKRRYHIVRHIERVRHHLSLDVADEALDAFASWAERANAIAFLPDGTVRDPTGAVLLYPGATEPDAGAVMPYPADSRRRKDANQRRLRDSGFPVLESLPPVVGEDEIEPQPAAEVARRAMALAVVAIRGESLASDSGLSVAEIRNRLPLGFDALSPNERLFIEAASPTQQQVLDATWRYEALSALQWALALVDALPFPSTICDVPRTARIMLDADPARFAESTRLRPAADLLDALDLHYRLHWVIREAQQRSRDLPGAVEAGVVAERHYALNWLLLADAGWDDVDTPT